MRHLVTATGQVTGTAIMMLPIALIVDRPSTTTPPSIQIWGAVIGLALLSTAVAYVMYFRILATAAPTNPLLVTFLIPVSALFLGITILGELLEPHHFIGMGLITLGLAAIDRRPLASVRARLHSKKKRPCSEDGYVHNYVT